MSIKDSISELKQLLDRCDAECMALEEKKVKASAPRLRKLLNDVKTKITPLKKKVTVVVNSIPVKKKTVETPVPQEEKKQPVVSPPNDLQGKSRGTARLVEPSQRHEKKKIVRKKRLVKKKTEPTATPATEMPSDKI
jgi:2,3-bisphosphoglycerate-independent phosphoglycerate mutase